MEPKVYLETTVFNWYFEHSRDESANVRSLFGAICDGRITAYTSEDAVSELSAAPEPRRSDMLELADMPEIVILRNTPEVERLRDAYIAHSVIPAKYKFDAAQAAIASVNGIRYVVTYNMKHLNNDAAKRAINEINRSMGYRELHICTAKEVLEDVRRGS